MQKAIALILVVLTIACRKDRKQDPPLQIDSNIEIVFSSRAVVGGNWELQQIQADGSNRHVIAGINQPIAFTVSHDGKKIAWTTFENGRNSLYVTAKTGGTPTLLTTGGNHFGMPDWSPDGTKILFMKGDSIRDRGIYVIDSDGKNEKRLVNTLSGAPKWFPNGNMIAYMAVENNRVGVYTMRADGSEQKMIAPFYYMSAVPYVSPAGDKIAVAVSGWELSSRIFLMNTDGSGLKGLDDGLGQLSSDDILNGSHNSPAWSPDGSKLAYVAANGNNSEICIVSKDGTNHQRLTRANQLYSYPSWSKDGQYIVFASIRHNSVNNDIAIMKANGQSITGITGNAGFNIEPVFVNP